jgi:hypothetical protein
MTESRGQMTEVRREKSEVRGQKEGGEKKKFRR